MHYSCTQHPHCWIHWFDGFNTLTVFISASSCLLIWKAGKGGVIAGLWLRLASQQWCLTPSPETPSSFCQLILPFRTSKSHVFFSDLFPCTHICVLASVVNHFVHDLVSSLPWSGRTWLSFSCIQPIAAWELCLFLVFPSAALSLLQFSNSVHMLFPFTVLSASVHG